MDLGTKCTSLVFALVAGACGTVVQPTDTGGDPEVPPPETMPGVDAGMDDASIDDPPPPPPTVQLTIAPLPTEIADERADIVTFEPNPKHDHVGASISLGAPFSCPEVFKYGYLLATQPSVGAELTRNPLAFRFHTTGAISIDYRVRREDSTLLDWTPAALDNGDAEVVLHRDGARGVADLAKISGRYFIDARARNAGGNEVTTSSCWEHRPLVTPVEVHGFVESPRPGSVFGFSLAGDSPISQLVNPGAGVPVFENQIFHTTNESVVVRIEMPTPIANYAVTIIDDIVTTTTTEAVACGTTSLPSKDPRCRKEPLIDEPTFIQPTGSLASVDWRLQVVDSSTGQTASECTVNGLSATCVLAPQAPNTARILGLQLFASGAAELFPPGGAGEQTFLGLGYTGQPASLRATACRTGSMVTSLSGVLTCTKVTTHHRVVALDSAFINFRSPPVDVQTGFDATTLSVAPYLPGPIPETNLLWNAGNDDLPGAN